MSEVLLLDIEGTVCPIDFVFHTLFPYARQRLGAWVAANPDDPLLADVARWAQVPREPTHIVRALEAWMDANDKATPLKAIQGRIWRGGFEEGALVAPMYPDVRPAIEAWIAAGRRVAVYSSGSVEAQQLLFAHTDVGDLAPMISAWFDTTTGSKHNAGSYTDIAAALGVAPAAVLFCSDIAAELHGAHYAGMEACWIVRDGPVADTRWSAQPTLPRP